MKILIEFDDLEHAMRVLAGMAGGTATVPPSAPPPSAPPAPPPSAPPAPPPTPPATAGAPTQADLSAAVQAYATQHGPKAAKAKLAEMGLSGVGAAAPEHYAYYISHLTA